MRFGCGWRQPGSATPTCRFAGACILSAAGNLAGGLAENLRPGGKRTSVYSIQILARRHPEWYRSDLAALLGLLADNKIAPHIAAVHELQEAPAALASLAGHAPPGKQVITITPADSDSAPPTSPRISVRGVRGWSTRVPDARGRPGLGESSD